MAQKIIWKGALWRGSPARHACNHVTRLINPVCCGSGKTDKHSMGLPVSYAGSPTLRNTSWTPARRFKTLHIRPCVHYMMAVCRKAVFLLLPSVTYPLQDQHDIPLVTFICKCLTIQYCLGKSVAEPLLCYISEFAGHSTGVGLDPYYKPTDFWPWHPANHTDQTGHVLSSELPCPIPPASICSPLHLVFLLQTHGRKTTSHLFHVKTFRATARV